MHRHVISAQKARVDISIRKAAHAKYRTISPQSDSITTGIVPVLIEVPRGQRNKFEFDKETGTMQLDRVLHSSCFYPGDYGFVPQTLCEDGDPIDVLVLSKFPLAAGVVANCRLVGVMDMEDEKGGDAKLIAVVASEPRTLSIGDIGDVPMHVKAEIQQFFELYKKLESAPGKEKWVKIRSWGDREQALKELKNSIDLYSMKTNSGDKMMDDQKDLAVGSVYDLTNVDMETPTSAQGNVVTAYIEVQKGDANKYEWDHETGYLTLDRVLHSSIFYPGDYGFIPRTLCGDGDPIDVVVLSTHPLAPGILADVRIIGALNMSDENGEDQKLLAVLPSDPRWNEVQDLGDVEEHVKREVAQFFETYKELENPLSLASPMPSPALTSIGRPKKKTKFATVRGWFDRKGALELLRQTQLNFKESVHGLGCFPKLTRLHIGDKAPAVVNAIVKAPKNTAIKHEILPRVGMMKICKVLHSAVVYPGDYGSLPQTLAEDGKSIECMLLSVFPLPLGCVVAIRVIALIDIEDQNGPNSKVIGVPLDEPRLKEYQDLSSIPDHVVKEVTEFFNTYKNLEGEDVWARVTGWRDKKDAMARIEDCRKRYFSFGVKMEDMQEQINMQEARIKMLEEIVLKKKK